MLTLCVVACLAAATETATATAPAPALALAPADTLWPSVVTTEQRIALRDGDSLRLARVPRDCPAPAGGEWEVRQVSPGLVALGRPEGTVYLAMDPGGEAGGVKVAEVWRSPDHVAPRRWYEVAGIWTLAAAAGWAGPAVAPVATGVVYLGAALVGADRALPDPSLALGVARMLLTAAAGASVLWAGYDATSRGAGRWRDAEGVLLLGDPARGVTCRWTPAAP